MTTQSRSLRLADTIAEYPYTFPGGYPMYGVTSDGGALCQHCCHSERELIGTTTGDDGWNVVSLEVNFENGDLYCDHCGQRIEAAYLD